MITAYPQVPTSLEVEVARGHIPNAEVYSAFGEMTTLANVETLLWETGMPTTLTVPNSIQLSVVSSSASDTGDISIKYLDGDLVEQSETLTLTGTTPVTTVATDIRAIHNVYSISGPVVGNINFTNNGTRYAYIPAGSIQYNTSVQRVPAGKRLMINSLYAGSTSGTSAARTTIKVETTFINGTSFASQGLFHPVAGIGLQDTSTTLSGFGPFPIPSGEWVALTSVSDKDAYVTGGYFGWLEDND